MSTATSTGPTSRAAGTSITERLVGALTTTWAAIQARHADVPDVVLTPRVGHPRRAPRGGHLGPLRRRPLAPDTTAGEHVVTADDVNQHQDDDEHQDD
ncbi:MAG: hypothetical protein L0H64_24495, partial [Pseudonocardia sp.]|nr:hypothetical protein [Pseudonocardia sp.]